MNHYPPLPLPPQSLAPHYADSDFDPFIGRTIIYVERLRVIRDQRRPDQYDETIALYLDNGKALALQLSGECCSTSAFTEEAFAAALELIGAEVQKVEHHSGGSTGYRGDEDPPVPERTAALALQYPPSEADSWHFIIFTTDKCYVTIDWRNMSNGYYDGDCAVVEIAPLPAPAHDAALERRLDVVLQVLGAVRVQALMKAADAVAAEVARGTT